MRLADLTKDQKIELKQQMLIQSGNVSWGELADADSLVSDVELEEEYAGTEFVLEDFSSDVCEDDMRDRLSDAVEDVFSEVLNGRSGDISPVGNDEYDEAIDVLARLLTRMAGGTYLVEKE